MKLHEQNDVRRNALYLNADALTDLVARLDRKVAEEYGDGTGSTMVNLNDFRSELIQIRNDLSHWSRDLKGG